MLPGFTHAASKVDKSLYTPVWVVGIFEYGPLAWLMTHSEYAEIYGQSAQARALHGVLVSNLNDGNVELILLLEFSKQSIGRIVLKEWNFVFVAKDPELSQSPARKELRTFRRVFVIVAIA